MGLLQMSFSGTVMILVIIIVRAIAKNKLPKRTFLLLWGLVVFRLLIPFSIPSTLSVYSLLDRNSTVWNVIAEMPLEDVILQTAPEPSNTSADKNANVEEMQSVTNAVPAVEDMSVISVWTIVWISGVVVCFAYFTIAYARCIFEFRMSLPVVHTFISEWLKKHPLRRKLNVRQSDKISTPLTYGILHPVILLPKNTDWENKEQLQYILAHEYTHICRFDMVFKMVVIGAVCVHWFNPLVWVMYALFNQDVELACDEKVVRQFGEKAKASYAQTLLTMEAKKSGLTPFLSHFSKNATEERIVSIMKNKKITVGAVAVSLCILIAVVVLFTTSADGEGTPNRDVEDTEILNTAATDDDNNMAEFEVPEVVTNTANTWGAERFDASSYLDWRVESLKHVYTYEDIEGMTLQVYQLNYEYLVENPEEVVLVGGMTIDEEGWLVPEYPNCNYLIFEQNGDELSYLLTLWENDCEAGSELFTDDLRRKLAEKDEKSYVSETDEDYYAVATSALATEVENFAQEIKKDILDKDWGTLAEKIVYPITVSGTTVNDASEFIELDFDGKLNKNFVDAIEAETCVEMFCNWQGICMGETGQLWFAAVEVEMADAEHSGMYQLKIIGINGMLD